MEETLKISKEAPEQKSQNYSFLREEGIKYIQGVAGKIWSDYNTHDPGVTILEALSYAITDLGYRTSYPMKDLITLSKNSSDLKNFFTAREILPNAPLTKNDYRKLLIDTEIEITIPVSNNIEYVGVKNAWIDKSDDSEVAFYADEDKSELSYFKSTTKSDQEKIQVGILYNILLEFDKSDYYGDLNANTVDGELTIYNLAKEVVLEGMVIDLEIECPRWDTEIDWNDLVEIIKYAKKEELKLTFQNLPDSYYVKSYAIVDNTNFEIEIYEEGESSENLINAIDLEKIRVAIKDFMFDPEKGLIKKYQRKIFIIQKIIDEVKARLHNNRMLCEDFYKISALKVEEIAVCADVELDLDADIERVQAKIYHAIDKFLSPAVNFYTIQEMLDLCITTEKYSIKSINKTTKVFTIDKNLTEKLSADDTVSVLGSTSNNGDYTVVSVSVNSYNSKFSDIEVREEIPSDLLTDGEVLSASFTNDENRYTIDTIFEGTSLDHGFIDDTELENADRKKVIHVSDLIQIIMGISGVTAIKDIQIANVPQDNDDGIPSKNVKWCLDLAFAQNYIPRLGIDICKFRFFKENIPFRANAEEVEDILLELEAQERDPKLRNPKLDLDVPLGQYRYIEEYTSVQEDFPLNYGVGHEGVPNLSRMSSESKVKREAQARQLKGYLMFFDQLLANYLSQLAHIRHLFSINAGCDEKGNFIIDRTYYTQPLFDIVPDVDALYINKDGHLAELNTISESESLFATRRNKFLDHLLARFSEQFSDYALLMYRLSGNKAPVELIEDKLKFLNSYPEISKNRGKGFNYKHPEKIWHPDNLSGLEKRVSLLMGIPYLNTESLNFSDSFTITETAEGFEYTISANGSRLLENPQKWDENIQQYHSIGEVKEVLELVVINGVYEERFNLMTDNNTEYYFQLVCNGEILGVSHFTNYVSEQYAIDDIKLLVEFFEKEFGIVEGAVNGNPESNRNNLAVPFYSYFNLGDPKNLPDDYISFSFDLYDKPFDFIPVNNRLFGSFAVESDSEDIEKEKQQQLWEIITNGIVEERYAFEFYAVFSIVAIDQTNRIFTVDKDVVGKFPDNNIIAVHGSDKSNGDYTVVSIVANTENGNYSDVKVAEEIPSDTLNGNEHLYSTYSDIDDENSLKTSYVFCICDRSGAILATSVERNFNQKLVDEFKTYRILKVCIQNSEGNDGYYPISSVSANGPDLFLNCEDKEIATDNADGELSVIESFTYTSVAKNKISIGGNITKKISENCIVTIIELENSKDYHYTLGSYKFKSSNTEITLNEDLQIIEGDSEVRFTKTYPYSLDVNSKAFSIDIDDELELESGDILTMWAGNEKLGDYTIKSFHTLSNRQRIVVDESIEIDKRGWISFTKLYPIVALKRDPEGLPEVKSVFIIKGGEDTKAIQKMIDFMKRTFINKEGFHLIEHPLLRPKHRQLQSGLSQNGDLLFTVKGVVLEVKSSSNKIVLKGNFANDIQAVLKSKSSLKVNLKVGQESATLSVNNAVYHKAKDKTEVKVNDDSKMEGIRLVSDAYLSYQKSIPIESISDDGRVITVDNEDILLLNPSGKFEITGSSGGANNGEYYVQTVDANSITIIRDQLMPVVLQPTVDCPYQITNPYTCIASVILPYWPERFNNSDFRKYIEKTLRTEAPAHIFLRICWVNPYHMQNLEAKYKRWIVENSMKNPDQVKISIALSNLIDALYQLRNIYPVGTLYDPDEHETLENAIILNNTMIGNA